MSEGKAWFQIPMLQVISVDLSSQGFSGLIGRDVLSIANFIYNGEAGIFTLAY
jgi:hypothetical protein